jgi:hypothetical protein
MHQAWTWQLHFSAMTFAFAGSLCVLLEGLPPADTILTATQILHFS